MTTLIKFDFPFQIVLKRYDTLNLFFCEHNVKFIIIIIKFKKKSKQKILLYVNMKNEKSSQFWRVHSHTFPCQFIIVIIKVYILLFTINDLQL